MTTKATIDTPWAVNPEGGYDPKLGIDPAFAGMFGWKDVTGEEGVEVQPGKTLYGGNYAAATGIQPDYDAGRVGGSGDPDYLMIEITFDEAVYPTLLEDIDGEDDYWVYWDEVEVIEDDGAVVLASNYKPKDDLPSQAEFGQWRARLARRGFSQEWITRNFGTGNTKNRGENDHNGRMGYLLDQGPAPGPNIPGKWTELSLFLEVEGWVVTSASATTMSITDGDSYQSFSVQQVQNCDLDHLTSPLRSDIEDWLVAIGYECP